MGRKKLTISRIENDRVRKVTFTKRKAGLLKKAMELSILCDCEVSLVVFSAADKCFTYSSVNLEKCLTRLSKHAGPIDMQYNTDYNAIHGDKVTAELAPITGGSTGGPDKKKSRSTLNQVAIAAANKFGDGSQSKMAPMMSQGMGMYRPLTPDMIGSQMMEYHNQQQGGGLQVEGNVPNSGMFRESAFGAHVRMATPVSQTQLTRTEEEEEEIMGYGVPIAPNSRLGGAFGGGMGIGSPTFSISDFAGGIGSPASLSMFGDGDGGGGGGIQPQTFNWGANMGGMGDGNNDDVASFGIGSFLGDTASIGSLGPLLMTGTASKAVKKKGVRGDDDDDASQGTSSRKRQRTEES